MRRRRGKRVTCPPRMLVWLYYLLLLLIHVTGWSLNLLGLPGLWLIVLGHIVYAWATGFDHYTGWSAIIWLFVLALAAEIIEFVAGAAGSKSAGGSKRGMAGAIIGGFAGGILATALIPIPIVGTVIGAVAGSFFGAAGVEKLVHPDSRRALRIGYGAAKGRFLGIVVKGGIGLVMAVVSLATALPIGSPPPVIPTTNPGTQPALPTSLPAMLP
ncbi:MAG: DUF456 domain-containing protein [Tepidisphaeraceae bacterium]